MQDLERKQANSVRHNKGEAQKIILPFQRFQGLKFYPINQNLFLCLRLFTNLVPPRNERNFAVQCARNGPLRWD